MNFDSVPTVESRILPPLTIISKGKAVTDSRVTIISKGRAVTVGPANINSNGRSVIVNDEGIPGKKQQQQVKCLPPLRVIPKQRPKNYSTKTPKNAATTVKQAITPVVAKSVTVKKYGKVSAPVPFFGPQKSSKLPISTKTPIVAKHQRDSMVQATGDEITDAINSYLEDDMEQAIQSLVPFQSNSDTLSTATMNVPGTNANGPADQVSTDIENAFIVETTDKATQTECFCACISQNNDVNVDEIARKVAYFLEINEAKKTANMKMSQLFPIKSTKDLERIEFNNKNTENFGVRLNLFLKYLKPRNSTTISTAFKEIISDEFLHGMNWDGSKYQRPLRIYEFFNVTLFEAWKNSMFSKDVYIDAMKIEIKKAHDRLAQRKRRQNPEIFENPDF